MGKARLSHHGFTKEIIMDHTGTAAIFSYLQCPSLFHKDMIETMPIAGNWHLNSSKIQLMKKPDHDGGVNQQNRNINDDP
jgi:hypothetical protein